MSDSKFYARGRIRSGNASVMEHILALIFLREEISRSEGLYMRRFFVRRYPDGGRLAIHVFHRGDEDPDPHDHPWAYRTRVIWNEYVDEIWNVFREKVREERLGWLACRHRPATHVHRVRISRPGIVWTWVRTYPKERNWFFYTPQGPVLGEEYKRSGGM